MKKILIYSVPILILILAFLLFMDKTSTTNQTDDANQADGTDVAKEDLEAIEEALDVEDFDEFKIEDIEVGTGEEAKEGDTISVHYTGTLINGTKFDSSVDRGEPFEFTLGAGQVIQGWDEGFAAMKVGGKRKIEIPSSMGYGASGAGADIPPNAGLVFEVELVGIVK